MKRLTLLSIVIVFLSTPSYGFFGVINNPSAGAAANIENGTVNGQAAIWDAAAGKWKPSAALPVTDNCDDGNLCVHGSGTLENADLEIDAHTALGATIALVPGVCRLIHNYNQGASDIDNTVDDPAKGKCFVLAGKTAQGSNRFRLTPVTTTNKICLDGTCSKNYIQFSPVVANSLAVCVSVPNGASSSYEYQCVSVVGTATTN